MWWSFRKRLQEEWLTDEEEAARQKERYLKVVGQKPYFSSLCLSPSLPSVKMRILIPPLQNSEIKTIMLVPQFWVTWRNTVSPSITLPLRNAVKMTMLKILQTQVFCWWISLLPETDKIYISLGVNLKLTRASPRTTDIKVWIIHFIRRFYTRIMSECPFHHFPLMTSSFV